MGQEEILNSTEVSCFLAFKTRVRTEEQGILEGRHVVLLYIVSYLGENRIGATNSKDVDCYSLAGAPRGTQSQHHVNTIGLESKSQLAIKRLH